MCVVWHTSSTRTLIEGCYYDFFLFIVILFFGIMNCFIIFFYVVISV